MDIVQVPAHPSNYTANSYKKVGIVFHWIVGELSAADAVFTKPNSKASAHYGIGSDGTIHQYVKDEYYAWHAGNSEANRKYIGIEHAGGQIINGVRKTPTKKCLDASVELCTYLAKKHGFGFERGVNSFKHTEVSDKYTQCCGTLDIDYITNNVRSNLHINDPKMSFEQWFNEAKTWNDAIKSKGYLADNSGITNKDYDSMNQEEKELLVMFYRNMKYMQASNAV